MTENAPEPGSYEDPEMPWNTLTAETIGGLEPERHRRVPSERIEKAYPAWWHNVRKTPAGTVEIVAVTFD